MSKRGHIVYACNVKTVQRKYMKGNKWGKNRLGAPKMGKKSVSVRGVLTFPKVPKKSAGRWLRRV